MYIHFHTSHSLNLLHVTLFRTRKKTREELIKEGSLQCRENNSIN